MGDADRSNVGPPWIGCLGSGKLDAAALRVYERRVTPPDVWFVYILRCGDDSLYTGIARDVRRRLEQHSAGRGARYTRSRGPLALCKTRRCASRSFALKLEYAVKRLPRPEKERLLIGDGLGRFARALARGAC